ncbi:thioredoxin domain-containing protein [Galbitalea sp. SE-J8]|uniref:DsbA family protein n=1 Tax=Galbitalea sp. SE-J8 TaxID=3054952 RepID=UPI00259CDE96|nr:thioredoxin domain-containing protein [Galbitalea sp. SE-J8]MDM4761690.1 thioredoxin domain-containing protein [Galbitalea sp. SE-J8]
MSDTSKRARRDHAREVARELREKERKRKRRNRLFIQGGVVVGILAIVAVVVIVIVSVNAPAGPGPKNMANGGIEFTANADGTGVSAVTGPGTAAGATNSPVDYSNTTDGVVQVDTYIDWACPACQQFEQQFSADLASAVAAGQITLTVHPVAILDRSYGTRYASRAANVAACVANYDPQKFLDVQSQFYENQPQEGSDGLDTAAILGLVKAGGVDDPDVTSCIHGESFKDWIRSTTDEVTGNQALWSVTQNGTGFVTPTILVNGQLLQNQTTVMDAIASAAAAETGTPAPTDTPTP